MAWAGSLNAPGPFNFRGCDLTAECLLAREMVRVQFPAAAPIPYRLRVSTRQSLQTSAHSGQHRGSLPLQNPKSECRNPKEIPSSKPEGLHSRAELLGFGVGSFGFRHSLFGFYPGVVADKQCTCPASKLMRERYPPTPPIQLRETRPMHREKPHKLLQVGVTPTPATNLNPKAEI